MSDSNLKNNWFDPIFRNTKCLFLLESSYCCTFFHSFAAPENDAFPTKNPLVDFVEWLAVHKSRAFIFIKFTLKNINILLELEINEINNSLAQLTETVNFMTWVACFVISTAVLNMIVWYDLLKFFLSKVARIFGSPLPSEKNWMPRVYVLSAVLYSPFNAPTRIPLILMGWSTWNLWI